jgi:hypothetical protein
LVLVFIEPSDDFIFLLLRMALRSLLDILSVLPEFMLPEFMVPELVVVWSVVVVVVVEPALGMFDGVPVWAPGVVPGATVWAKAALVVRARAATRRVAFMTGEIIV